MRIIGLTGPSGSGKSTIARIIANIYGAQREGFSLPLREGVSQMFGFTTEQLREPSLKHVVDDRYGKSPVEILQIIGTDVCQDMFREDIWVMRLDERLRAIEKLRIANENLFVLDDVRTEQQAEYVRDNGMLIHIHRGLASTNPERPVHKIDSGVNQALGDYIFFNNRPMEELESNLVRSLSAWWQKI